MNKAIVKPTSKGQVTIPKRVRDLLGITSATPLGVEVRQDTVVFRILTLRPKDQLRDYSAADIERFLKEDRVDRGTRQWLKRVLAA